MPSRGRSGRGSLGRGSFTVHGGDEGRLLFLEFPHFSNQSLEALSGEGREGARKNETHNVEFMFPGRCTGVAKPLSLTCRHPTLGFRFTVQDSIFRDP